MNDTYITYLNRARTDLISKRDERVRWLDEQIRKLDELISAAGQVQLFDTPIPQVINPIILNSEEKPKRKESREVHRKRYMDAIKGVLRDFGVLDARRVCAELTQRGFNFEGAKIPVTT